MQNLFSAILTPPPLPTRIRAYYTSATYACGHPGCSECDFIRTSCGRSSPDARNNAKFSLAFGCLMMRWIHFKLLLRLIVAAARTHSHTRSDTHVDGTDAKQKPIPWWMCDVNVKELPLLFVIFDFSSLFSAPLGCVPRVLYLFSASCCGMCVCVCVYRSRLHFWFLSVSALNARCEQGHRRGRSVATQRGAITATRNAVHKSSVEFIITWWITIGCAYALAVRIDGWMERNIKHSISSGKNGIQLPASMKRERFNTSG